MRCKKEFFIKGRSFHFYNHAVDEEALFYNRDDYLILLRKLKTVLLLHSASIFAYCLMPNHFHFLIRQDNDRPAYKIFNNLFSYYVQVFNKRHNRKGRLFQGPLKHKLINKEEYLIYLCQYIHCNPVKAGIINNIEEWEFSNYLEWTGNRNGTLFCDDLLNEYFENREHYEESIHEYEQYLKEKEFRSYLFDEP